MGFRKDEKAVAAVVAVAILLAVTVILAGLTYVIANKVLANRPTTISRIAFKPDESYDRATVTGVGAQEKWDHVVARLQAAPPGGVLRIGGAAAPHQNQAAVQTAQTTAVSSEVTVDPAGDVVRQNDFLEFCSVGGTGPYGLVLASSAANSLLATIRFDAVHPCV